MLAEKVEQLKTAQYAAGKVVIFWENAIARHGEPAAEAFYKSLGLNHLETKSVEWEGLTLSREPTEAEKICVKGVATAQESSKAKIGNILLTLRTELITDGLKGIKKLVPATYHELTLTASSKSRESLRNRLILVHRQGRMLIAAELAKKDALPSADDFDELDDLTDITDARVTNDVQSRITSAAARFALLGLTGTALWAAVGQEMADGSLGYIDRAAQGLANRVINIGRGDEAQNRSDQWERVEYSAILDAKTCGPCDADDGQEAATEDELTPVPNPECEGGDWCRCFHVFVSDTIA